MNRQIYISKGLCTRAKKLCRIMQETCGADPTEEKRQRAIVTARTMVAYQLLEEGFTEHAVGAVLGWDHSTINYYRDKMEKMLTAPGYDAEREIWKTFQKKLEKDVILVVIPFLAGAAQGNELELSVTGWRKFFREPHRIVIVGDYHPIVESGSDIMFIPCRRIAETPGQYRPHLDHVHKFRTVRRFFPKSRGFIYTCDDIYAVADITMEDIVQPKYPEIATKYLDDKYDGKTADWWSDRCKTNELCHREGLPVRDWVCHLPVYYEWDKLLAIYDKYDCDHVSYIVENIYFNQLYSEGVYASDARDYRDEVRTANPGIRPIGSVKWICNANCGWSEELEKILREHYWNSLQE